MIHASIPSIPSVESATAVFISTWDPRSWPQLYPDSRLGAPGRRSGVQRCTSFQRCLPSSALRSVAETLVVDDETTLRIAATSSRRHGASSSDSLLAKSKGSSDNAQQAIRYSGQMVHANDVPSVLHQSCDVRRICLSLTALDGNYSVRRTENESPP